MSSAAAQLRLPTERWDGSGETVIFYSHPLGAGQPQAEELILPVVEMMR